MAFEAAEQVALGREKQRAFNLEQVRRQPFEPDRRIGAVGATSEILAEAGLKVEIRPDRMAVERLHLCLFEPLAKRAVALRLEPQPIDVAAHESLAIPAIAVA